MSRFKYILIICFLMSISETLYAVEKCQIPPIEEREIKPYTCSVKLDNKEDLEFTVPALSVDDKGPTTLLVKKNGKNHPITLQKYREEICDLFADRLGDLLLIFYEIGDAEGTRSIAEAYSIPDFKRKWKTDLSGFNLHVVRKGNFAFISTVGFAAKLDVRSGKFSWRHKGLYESRTYNGGQPVTDNKGAVRFSNNQGEDLIIDEKTGKILNPANAGKTTGQP
jgi:hypothetical protein